jgi:hypothetical protein
MRQGERFVHYTDLHRADPLRTAVAKGVALHANEANSFRRYNRGMSNHNSHCDLDHVRPRPAVVRIQIKSTRARRPGHPTVRDLALCSSHARQLRELGIEIVEA